MAKRNQGFGTQGGQSFIPKNTTGGGYSATEIAALSKVGATDLGMGIVADPDHVALCGKCGRPVAGDINSTPGREPEELQRGMHFKCFMEAEQVRLRTQKARFQAEFDALPEEEKEARRAEAYNNALIDENGQPIVAQPQQTAPVYRPKPGELAFNKIQAAGGVSNVLKDEPTVLEQAVNDTDRTQTAAREAEDLAELRRLGLISEAPEAAQTDGFEAVPEAKAGKRKQVHKPEPEAAA